MNTTRADRVGRLAAWMAVLSIPGFWTLLLAAQELDEWLGPTVGVSALRVSFLLPIAVIAVGVAAVALGVKRMRWQIGVAGLAAMVSGCGQLLLSLAH